MPAHLYRFAMFGRSDSGKTCILSALSMSHRSNPAGHTVTWVPDSPESDAPDKDVRTAYAEGKVALTKARAAMDGGEKPAPSNNRILRYRFDFSTIKPQPRSYKVELTDYSGELIDPRMNASGMARILRKLLGTMDGLFVLAEAPKPGTEQNRLPQEFELLQQAFALLAAEKEKTKVAARTPVVLLFNKWDRRHPRPATPAERAAEVDEFLNGPNEPPHLSLANFLQGAVAEHCYHTVAVSAFGSARKEMVADAEGFTREVELPPIERPLPSFGLEDGFIWAARTRDEQDLAEFERSSNKLAYCSVIPWFGLNAFNPFAASTVRREGNQLAERFPRSSDAYKRVKAGAAKALRIGALRSLTCAAVLFVALFGVETTRDLGRFRRAEADFARIDLDMADLERHQESLLAYHTAPVYRHALSRVFISRTDAQALQAKMYDRHETLLRDGILALAPKVLDQEALAAAYVEKFPSGPYLPEASRITQEAKTLRAVKANADHLDRTTQAVATLEGLTAIGKPIPPADMAAVVADASKAPHPDQLSDAQRELMASLGKKLDMLKLTAAQKDGAKAVYEQILAGKYDAAGKDLANLKSVGLNAADAAKITNSAMVRAGERVTAAETEKRWPAMLLIVGEMDKGWRANSHLNREQLLQLDRWKEKAYQGEHRDLYIEVYRDPSESQCRRYLDSAKVPDSYKTRRSEVQGMLKYHTDMKEKRPLIFKVDKLHIGARSDYLAGRRFNLDVAIGINSICGLRDKYNGWDANVDVSIGESRSLTLSGEDTIKIEIKFGNGYDAYTELGYLEETVRISALAEGKKFTLSTEGKYYYDKSMPSHVVVSVAGLPLKPELTAPSN